ncbi:MAG: eukaryotic-like serine/threonine-protein kinase [Blastocatellia bacterium]|jgi:serine/threonine protein kinase|nr:eukaryotic-like serine/threonine-protein kinase [Blastocatellia bacterium]
MSTWAHWQRIKAIFHSAQECAPADRASFLDSACGDDGSMRQEVESLLAADETNEDFLGTPAYELMAGILADEKTEFVAGQEVGPYTILSSLGVGGMGQVYLAQDARLPRKVALKLLSMEVARDERRVQLFEHEAQAASRLNHPNVCMILEIGTAPDGRRFIAMEHIDGVTLRDLMERRRLAPAEALDVAIQVAAALAAAHAAGIVHRDIKPENIMLRPDGYIKVLDFGIAKLGESLPRLGEPHAASTARLSTEPGMLMGTVGYMSPEQLREAPVDQRTDIWSLGVVFHEMVTGTRPFEAQTSSEIIALILGNQPTEFQFGDELPVEFQQLIKKALTKDRAERYQTVKELTSDLQKVRREFSRRNEIDGTPELVAQQTLNLELSDGNERPKPFDRRGQTIFFRLKSQAISTADFLLSEIKEHKTTAVFTGIAAIFAVLLIVPSLPRLLTWINHSSESRQALPAQVPKMVPMGQITNSGTSVCAAISPDGKYVAHVEKKDGMQQLLVNGLAPSGSSVVVDADNVEYLGVTFSPNSNYVYFTNRRREKGDTGTLYQVALSGGLPKRIKEGVDSPITFSPSGDSFAFIRSDITGGEYSLIIAGTNGTPERVITKRENGNRLSVDGPAWSPDGKTIVCGAGWWNQGYHMNLIEFDLANDEQRAIGDQRWFSVSQVAWLDDQSGLIISAREQPMGPGQLWRIPYPRGKAEPITTDPADYRGVSLSRDTNMIVSVQSQRITKIWTVPDGDAQRAEAIAPVLGLAFGLSWTANGKIVFSSIADDHLNISVIDSDGSNQKQLTVDAGDNYSPATSPDGRFIVFSSNRTGSFNIWRMNAKDSSDLKQLTFGDANFYPSCSADSQWVFYDNSSTSRFTVWKVPIDGGDPVQLTDKYARMPVVSPDNQSVACRYKENGAPLGIAIIPVQGGPPLKLLPEIPIKLFQRVEWISKGHALTYIDIVNGVSNIWSYNLDHKSAHQLTNFREDQIFAYSWSPDNKQLACERGAEINNVMTIANQK